MILGNKKERLTGLISKYSANNSEILEALAQWNGFASGEYDTRSGPKAAETFQKIANKNQDGCIILALIFFELFMEFGEFPRKSLFEEGLHEQVENVLKTLKGEEKEVVDWFLRELRRRA
jgi:hypothetical protein